MGGVSFTLKILYLSRNAFDEINNNNIFDSIDKNYKINTEYGLNIFETKDKYNCEYLIFPDIISESHIGAINKILEKDYYHKFYKFCDVIIISVNSLFDEDSKFLFKNLQNFRIQPIILYLTKNENCPNIEDLYKIINDLCFYDKRNLYAFKYPTNDIDKIMIKNLLMNFIYYYHEWDSLPSINEDIFNILILGESGSGKSSFINQFLQEKKAKEMTKKITKYFHPKYPITIFDTPGHLSDEIINAIDKNNIDLILFFITPRNIDLLNSKIQFIKEIIRKNKEIVIIYNTFGIDGKENTIKNILRQVNSDKIIDNIIKIDLNQYIEEKDNNEDNHSNYKINKCYGMDSLFNYIYEIFKPYIINVFYLEYQNFKGEKIDINSFKYWERIKSIYNKNNNLKTNAIKIILSYSTKSFFKNKKETLKKMIIDIHKAYGIEIENKDIENKDKFGDLDWVNNKEEDRLSRNEFLKLIEGFDIGDFSLDPDDYIINILFSGFCVLSKHIKDKQKSFINYCYSINKAIDGFKEMAQEWTLIYSELKFHKTQREWVKKCFVVKNLNENEGKKIEVKKLMKLKKKIWIIIERISKKKNGMRI